MPISKNGRLYFTESQYKAAKAYSALAYARSSGYDLVKDGNSYHLRQHDSMVFTTDGHWYWNSRNLNGRALEFLQYYEGYTLPQAVDILTKGQTHPPPPLDINITSDPPKPFTLPEKSPTYKRLFAYLCITRKLDSDIINELIHQKRIYESIQQYTCSSTGQQRIAHNVVFVGMDATGEPRSAFLRGTNTAVSYKRDVPGSLKKYAFCCPGKGNITTVSVFEAAIDAISHASLAKLHGIDWQDQDRIALGGIAILPLLYYLKTHPNIRHINLCLDNDAAGQKAVANITAALHHAGYDDSHGYTISSFFPPLESGKDWNEHLVKVTEHSFTKAKTRKKCSTIAAPKTDPQIGL